MENKKLTFSIFYLILAFWVLILLQEAFFMFQHLDEVPYSRFKRWLSQDRVAEVALTDTRIRGKLKPEE